MATKKTEPAKKKTTKKTCLNFDVEQLASLRRKLAENPRNLKVAYEVITELRKIELMLSK